MLLLHPCLSSLVVETEAFSCQSSRLTPLATFQLHKSSRGKLLNFTSQVSNITIDSLLPSHTTSILNRLRSGGRGWKIRAALNTGGIPDNGGQQNFDPDSPDLGRTRLGRIVSAGGRQLLEKLNSARKNFPMKIFLLLLGFYTANALATILGQTGDWDVLVAGVVVAAIEGIGMLVYKRPSSLPTGRLQSFVTMMNYWKAGVCLGLFVDAFKLGS